MSELDFLFFLFSWLLWHSHFAVVVLLAISPVSDSHDYTPALTCPLFTNLHLSSSSLSFTNPHAHRSSFHSRPHTFTLHLCISHCTHLLLVSGTLWISLLLYAASDSSATPGIWRWYPYLKLLVTNCQLLCSGSGLKNTMTIRILPRLYRCWSVLHPRILISSVSPNTVVVKFEHRDYWGTIIIRPVTTQHLTLLGQVEQSIFEPLPSGRMSSSLS